MINYDEQRIIGNNFEYIENNMKNNLKLVILSIKYESTIFIKRILIK